MTTCPPTKMDAATFAALGPCDKLALYEQAAFALSTGEKRKIIRHGEHWLEFHAGSLGFIEREIARLRALCPTATANGGGARTAITIGRTRC